MRRRRPMWCWVWYFSFFGNGVSERFGFFIASESFAKGVQIRIRWFSFFFVCNVVSERTTFLPQSNRFTFSFVFGFVTAFPNERSAVLWAVYVGVYECTRRWLSPAAVFSAVSHNLNFGISGL